MTQLNVFIAFSIHFAIPNSNILLSYSILNFVPELRRTMGSREINQLNLTDPPPNTVELSDLPLISEDHLRE